MVAYRGHRAFWVISFLDTSPPCQIHVLYFKLNISPGSVHHFPIWFPLTAETPPLPPGVYPFHLLSVLLQPALSVFGRWSHIRHVIREEMRESSGGGVGRNWGWWKNDVTSRPRLGTGALRHLQAARSAPGIHLPYTRLSVAAPVRPTHPLTPNTRQTYSSSQGGVTGAVQPHRTRRASQWRHEKQMKCVHRCRAESSISSAVEI